MNFPLHPESITFTLDRKIYESHEYALKGRTIPIIFAQNMRPFTWSSGYWFLLHYYHPKNSIRCSHIRLGISECHRFLFHKQFTFKIFINAISLIHIKWIFTHNLFTSSHHIFLKLMIILKVLKEVNFIHHNLRKKWVNSIVSLLKETLPCLTYCKLVG